MYVSECICYLFGNFLHIGINLKFKIFKGSLYSVCSDLFSVLRLLTLYFSKFWNNEVKSRPLFYTVIHQTSCLYTCYMQSTLLTFTDWKMNKVVLLLLELNVWSRSNTVKVIAIIKMWILTRWLRNNPALPIMRRQPENLLENGH